MPPIKDPLLVASIDFGTTYSGYAIQFKHEFDPKDPTKIRAPQAWNGGKQNLMSFKTPTCLLLTPHKEIDCFGFEAEEKYAELCMEKKNKEYYYFRRFKMKLQEGQGLKKDSILEDEAQNTMPALKVFSLSIQCLCDNLMEMLDREGTGVKMEEILWVLTVPAIWDDRAKEFMKEAGKMAGIDDDHLMLALEPEAASLYCQYLPVDKFSAGGQVKFSDAKPGTTYMVVDLGGGTADITVHEKLANNQIKEVYQASGGPWGGTQVDSAFWQLFISIAGGPVMAAFQREQKYDYLDLMKEFECIKRTFHMKMKTMFNIKFPASLNDLCKEKLDQSFAELTAESPKKKDIEFVGDKMRLKVDLVASLFKTVTNKIVKHMAGILEDTEAGKKVSMILMVGGFSESAFVQDEVRAAFKDRENLKILIPKQAGLCVLNGAIVFGRIPRAITTRILRYTYGVRVGRGDFASSQQKVGTKGRKAKTPDEDEVFSPFIREGTSVKHGHQVIERYATSSPMQTVMGLKVFVAKGCIPELIGDPNCHKLGELRVDVPNPSEEKKRMLVLFTFGSTSLHVVAVEEESKVPCMAEFGLLE